MDELLEVPAANLPGVVFTPPPTHLLADALKIVNASTEMLPASARGAIIGIATETGMNAAIVQRLPAGFTVVAWVGKSWGSTLEYGTALQMVW